MKYTRSYIFVLIFVAFLHCNIKAESLLSNVADSLSIELKHASNSADSLLILTDLFDVSDRSHRDSIGNIALQAAINSDNTEAALDLLRNLANVHLRSDSLLQRDLDLAMQFEPSDSRNETVAFIRMLRNMYQIRYATPLEQEKELRRLLREISTDDESDIYEQIVRLHALSLYIGASSQGVLLSNYMTKLEELIDGLSGAYAIKNCYYVQASIVYLQNDEYEKSVNADRKLLACIDKLQSGELGMKRRFRNYDGNRYVVYSRLLTNYPVLTNEEAETYYNEVMKLIERDDLSRHTNDMSGRPQIFYAMHKKDYKTALDLIKKYGEMPYNANIRRQILQATIESAKATGENAMLMDALQEYSSLLKKTLDDRLAEKSKELEIVYDIQHMKSEHARSAWRMQRNYVIISITASVILLILFIVVVVLWRHASRLAKKNADVNEELRTERDNLKTSHRQLRIARDEAERANRVKSDFIKNISSEISVPLHTINEYTNLIVDCSEAGVKPYLKHFADLVAQNSDVLTTIVNDVLSLSDIDSKLLKVEYKKEQLRHICEIAVDSVRHRVASGVELKLAKGLPDQPITTDPQRLLQILMQLLKNAAKFTTEGEIEVGFKADNEAGKVEIYVSDTGCGIPSDSLEKIFERFVKLDRSTTGIGIGLPIARHLAELLGGTLTIDSQHRNGARFVITLPL